MSQKNLLSQLSGLSTKLLNKTATKDIPRLIQNGEYGEATRLGALLGANYLAAQMRDGTSNDEASFLPEVHFYTGKRKLKLAGCMLLQTDGKTDTKEVVRNVVATAFKEKKPAAILTIFPGFTTGKVQSLKKGQRLSKNPHRVSAALSTLYTKPEQFEYFASLAVGTPKELKRAGFEDSPWLVGVPGVRKAA